MESTATKNKSSKQIHIHLNIDEVSFKKLNVENPMPAWVLGEAIAKSIRQGQIKIDLTLADVFVQSAV